MWRRGVAGALLLVFFAALPAAAQDQDLDPFLLANRDETASATDVEARGFQLYRVPLSFHVRSMDKHPWGLRVTFPVSLSSLSIKGVSDVGGFVEKLGIAAIIPGLEVEIPVGSRPLVRPFGEVGIGKGSDSSAEVFYGAGLRAHTTADPKKLHVTYGGMISGRKTPEFDGTDARYVRYEGGADVQVPLGFSVRGGQARGGLYVIGRAFDGLETGKRRPATDRASRASRNWTELLDRARSAHLENPAAVAGRRLPVRPRLRRPNVPDVPVLMPVRGARQPRRAASMVAMSIFFIGIIARRHALPHRHQPQARRSARAG